MTLPIYDRNMKSAILSKLQENLGSRRFEQVKTAAETLLSNLRAGDTPYTELSVWLGFLRALAMIHHTHHWETKGQNFYGDHLLFERLYKTSQDEIDMVGEKVIGLNQSTKGLDCQEQIKIMQMFMKIDEQESNPVIGSWKAELVFVAVGELVGENLKQQNLLTKGLENLMGAILDSHESHVYLLSQRVNML